MIQPQAKRGWLPPRRYHPNPRRPIGAGGGEERAGQARGCDHGPITGWLGVRVLPGTAIGPLSSSRRQTGSEPAARTSSSRLAQMSLSTAFRAASPSIFVGSSTPRSSRREAADRIMSCVSVSLDIGILRWVAAASLPPPPRPHLGHAAGGAGSRGAPCAPNGHTTALFAVECQSFLDNVIS